MNPDVFCPLIILWWIVGTIVNGCIAHAKGRDTGNIVVMSLFLSPAMAYLYLLAVPNLEAKKKLEAKEIKEVVEKEEEKGFLSSL